VYATVHTRHGRAQYTLPVPHEIESLTFADARTLIAGGEKRALELHIPCNIAVVDGVIGAVDAAVAAAKLA